MDLSRPCGVANLAELTWVPVGRENLPFNYSILSNFDQTTQNRNR